MPHAMRNDLVVAMILRSHPPSYHGFVICYKSIMEVQKSVRSLFLVLISAEVERENYLFGPFLNLFFLFGPKEKILLYLTP